jgi:hypothetical protein
MPQAMDPIHTRHMSSTVRPVVQPGARNLALIDVQLSSFHALSDGGALLTGYESRVTVTAIVPFRPLPPTNVTVGDNATCSRIAALSTSSICASAVYSRVQSCLHALPL